jgi:multiple sugar transport system ATP-binding protein
VTAVRYVEATRTYPGTETPAVDSLSLDIADGELLVLVGPSGSGKSTALRMLAGLEPLDAGAVVIGDRDVTEVRPRDRDIAMVFQNYALYPQLSVAENMGFALKQHGVRKEERTAACARRPASSVSSRCWTGSRGSSRVGSASAWRWGARSSGSLRST